MRTKKINLLIFFSLIKKLKKYFYHRLYLLDYNSTRTPSSEARNGLERGYANDGAADSDSKVHSRFYARRLSRDLADSVRWRGRPDVARRAGEPGAGLPGAGERRRLLRGL